MAVADIIINPEMQINSNEMESVFYPQIVCTDDWFMTYIPCDQVACGHLFKYFFVNKTWRILRGQPLPKFTHYSMVMLGQIMLAIHGTTDDNRISYSTYIGDVTHQQSEFQCIATLNMPTCISFGEQRIVTDNQVLYALVGYKIKGSNETSVYRLDGKDRTWRVLYDGTPAENVGQDYDPCLEQGIFHYNNQIIVFPDVLDSNPDNFSILTVFDIASCTWRPVNTTTCCESASMPPYFTCNEWVSADEYSLAQCPTVRRHVYVQAVSYFPGQRWAMWRLDLDTFHWHEMRVTGPMVPTSGMLGVTITPSGRVYSLRTVDPVFLGQFADFGLPVRTDCLVYSVQIRTPRLVDAAFAAVADLQLRRELMRGAGVSLGLPNLYDRLPRTLADRFRDAQDNSADEDPWSDDPTKFGGRDRR